MNVRDDRHELLLDELARDPDLQGGGYLPVHRHRFLSDLRNIERHYRGGKILEIGAYPLHLTFCLQKLEYDVTSVDIDPARGERFIRRHDLTVIRSNIETKSLPFEDETFDLLLLHEVFEHLRINPIASLRELHRVLKVDGKMIVTTPNLYSLHTIALFLLGRGLHQPYREFSKLEEFGHMGHVREYSRKEMTTFLDRTGFEIVEARYAYYKGYFRSGSPLLDRLIHLVFRMMPPFWRPFQVLVARRRREPVV